MAAPLPSLKAHIKTNQHNQEELYTVLSRATSSITFLGGRIITVQGYEGSFLLNTITNMVLKDAWGKRDRNPGVTLKERALGVLTQRKLQSLYRATDEQLTGKSFFTRTCAYVREFFSMIGINFFSGFLRPRDYVGGISLNVADFLNGEQVGVPVNYALRGCFYIYEEAQFIALFGNERDNDHGRNGYGYYLHADGMSYGRVLAKTDSILEKAREAGVLNGLEAQE